MPSPDPLPQGEGANVKNGNLGLPFCFYLAPPDFFIRSSYKSPPPSPATKPLRTLFAPNQQVNNLQAKINGGARPLAGEQVNARIPDHAFIHPLVFRNCILQTGKPVILPMGKMSCGTSTVPAAAQIAATIRPER